jgi:hypothetical protein
MVFFSLSYIIYWSECWWEVEVFGTVDGLTVSKLVVMRIDRRPDNDMGGWVVYKISSVALI